MDRAVIKAMAAFVYLAILKDALICLVIYWITLYGYLKDYFV